MKNPNRRSTEFKWEKFQGVGEPGSFGAIRRRLGRSGPPPSFFGALRFFFMALREKSKRYHRQRDIELPPTISAARLRQGPPRSFIGSLRFFFAALLEKATRYQFEKRRR